MREDFAIPESIINAAARDAGPHAIVVGNEKGGTGKSTVAMHLVVALLKLGFTVGSVDLDGRQGTLSRYLANREAFRTAHGAALRMPSHRRIERSTDDAASLNLDAAWQDLAHCEYVVIDSPGSDSLLSRLGHERADTLVTPINDSYLDIDVLAHIDLDKREVLAPSVYTQMVWEQNNRRVLMGRPPIDWIVMRNRLSHVEAHNKRDISVLLERLAARIGFRVAAGFGERVVFRELFLKGLTLIDQVELGGSARLSSPSHVAARRELSGLLETIGILTPETEPA